MDNYQRTFRFIIFIFVLLSSKYDLDAQSVNFIDEQFHGFEISGWTEGNNWSYDESIVATGSRSFKFSCVNCDGDYKSWGPTSDDGLLNLAQGTYTLKMNVWVTSGSTLSSFNFVIRTPTWQNCNFKFSDIVERDQWVTVTKEITISDEVIDDRPMLRVTDTGAGTFYLDDIQIIGEWVEQESTLLLTYAESAQALENVLPRGIYEAKIKVFKGTDNNMSALYTYLTEPWIPIQWDIADLPENQWVEVSQEVEIVSDVKQSLIRFHVSNQSALGGGSGTAYLDDFTLSFLRNIDPEEVLGLEDSVVGLTVYPNPSNGTIFLQSQETGFVSIYDTKGQHLLSTDLMQNEPKSLSLGVPAGVYIVRFFNSSNIENSRIIIR